MKSQKPHQETDPKDRVSVPQKIAFGSGLISYSIMNNGFNQMLNVIFNVNFGVSPVLLGWITALSRVYDAVSDPVMGSITDNTRSRWGRRRPYLALGGFLGGIFFASLWWAPQQQSDTFYFGWILVGALLLTTAFTIYSVPYIALSFEMSPDYHERTRVMAYKVGMGKLGGILVGSLFWWTQRPIFDDTIEGMRYVGIGAGILIFIISLVPTLFVRENPEVATVARKQKKTPLLKSMKSTLSQPAFLIIIGLTLCLICSLNLVNFLGFYVSLYYIFDGVQREAANVSLAAGFIGPVVGLLSIPVVTVTSSLIGKRRALACFLALAFIGSILKWYLYTPAGPYLQLIPNALMGAGLGATWLLLNAMIPDVCDLDELKTGGNVQKVSQN
ncbi:MFS transporter [Puniceicoccus vermicola]|uniref:MFS transporter n=1 Tax=Puniceicoccus vermicola TaxID=388746 RepID=A0A7X1B1U0_9BACT|nr:MFS transporter [Puniceicoccus vermicola]MBC2603977.1 MFS transporter [Puniceicoccus vermicola]